MLNWMNFFAASNSQVGLYKNNFSSTTKPLRRCFLRYNIEVINDEFWLIDQYEVYNSLSRRYEPDEFRTPIDLIKTGVNNDLHLPYSQEKLRELSDKLSELRREIDRFGLKIFFDPQADGTVRPKWRYRLFNRWIIDPIKVGPDPSVDSYVGDPDLMSPELVHLTMINSSYFQTEIWRVWFGRRMQRKRELIILKSASDTSLKLAPRILRIS